jgi:hypothetical protein
VIYLRWAGYDGRCEESAAVEPIFHNGARREADDDAEKITVVSQSAGKAVTVVTEVRVNKRVLHLLLLDAQRSGGQGRLTILSNTAQMRNAQVL